MSPIRSRILDNKRLLVLVRMQPDTVHRLTVVVEDVLAAVVGAVDGAHGAVGEGH